MPRLAIETEPPQVGPLMGGERLEPQRGPASITTRPGCSGSHAADPPIVQALTVRARGSSVTGSPMGSARLGVVCPLDQPASTGTPSSPK